MNGLRTHNELLQAAQRRSDTDGYPLRDNASACAFWAVCGLVVIAAYKATPWAIGIVLAALIRVRDAAVRT